MGTWRNWQPRFTQNEVPKGVTVQIRVSLLDKSAETSGSPTDAIRSRLICNAPWSPTHDQGAFSFTHSASVSEYSSGEIGVGFSRRVSKPIQNPQNKIQIITVGLPSPTVFKYWSLSAPTHSFQILEPSSLPRRLDSPVSSLPRRLDGHHPPTYGCMLHPLLSAPLLAATLPHTVLGVVAVVCGVAGIGILAWGVWCVAQDDTI